MLRDVFYYGDKPNVHPREQLAENLADARSKAITRDFWIINEFCDYKNFDWDFDFEFLPDEDVWAEDHNNVWPSQHQKDSGTWLCPKEHSDIIIYRNDVDPVIRKNQKNDNWVELDLINHNKFDFSWHPDPTDPPYVYKWPSKFFPAEFKHVLEYRVPGATQEKYMNTIAELVPEYDRWVEHQEVDKSRFDMSWRPNPLDPPFIYVWGNKYIDGKLKPTLEYHAPDATDKKYMPEHISVLPEWDKWVEVQSVDKNKFDFSWRPDPREPAFIYVFGNEQHEGTIMPTVEYHCPDATDVKYVDDIKAKLAPKKELFEHLEDSYGIDYSWRPDPTSPPYIYAWGNQWNTPEDKVSIQFVVPGATEYKYIDERAIRRPCMDNWVIPEDVDTTGFDFSWEPSPAAPPYIYEFATQWQKTGGPQYVVLGATEKQYVDFQKVKKLPSTDNWNVPDNIDSTGFDFSWHPDDTSPPYAYVFATQWAFSGGPTYTVPGATEIKYVEDQIATAKKDMSNWVYDANLIDVDNFDFSWHPYVEDQPYVYEFGTQHQKTGGPKYITSGANSSSPTKYIDTRILKAIRLPNIDDSNWKTLYNVKNFDYSWHPDSTEEPFIYVFGNNLYPAEEMPTVQYHAKGATEIKYINDVVATLDDDRTNWIITQPIDEEAFDFSWKPNPKDPSYIYRWGNKYISNKYEATIEYVVPGATEIKYMSDDVIVLPEWDKWEIPNDIDTEGFDFAWRPDPLEPNLIWEFGTQWQKTGGPRYKVPGATEIKYLDFQQAIALPNKTNWKIPNNIDASTFDFSWHPNNTEPDYIYQFGTQWALSGGPSYITPGATEIKYVEDQTAAALPDKTNWVYDSTLIDVESFDFSWHPYVEDQPYVYEFGTQWQKTGGPKYITPGADSSSPTKYVDTRIIKATRLPNRDDSNWNNLYNIKDFDYSWHPDSTDEPFTYVFGNNLYPAEECTTIEYRMQNATQIKYIRDVVATLDVNRDNWVIEQPIDESKFDFTWIPNPKDPPYIYRWGNKYISNKYKSTIEYIVLGATDIKYMTDDVEVLPEIERWEIPNNIDTTGFDFTWRPDPLEPNLIWEFGTQWQKTGGPKYIAEGAFETKYVDFQKVTVLPNDSEWSIPDNVDISGFDFSWHPDDTDPPYIYQFGTQWALSGGPRYEVSGATEIKYMDILVAQALPNRTNWVYDENEIDVDSFDFSWHPYVEDQPYVYQFGTQWQKTGGPRYITPGADLDSPVKYIDTRIIKARRLPNSNNDYWTAHYPIRNFDYSWHPDETEDPYIYVFGNNQYLAEECATIEYRIPGATTVKYIPDIVARLDVNMDKWVIPDDVDATDFDFSWIPNPSEPPYIYEFGTQWQKTGGPKYVMPGAWRGTKYVDVQTAKRLPDDQYWTIPDYIDKTSFDFSWHPDATEEPYNYVFATQWAFSGGPVYTVPGATEIKYVDEQTATALPDKTNWEYDPDVIDVENFDFSWHPYVEDQPYIYQFGTQWWETGGPRYVTPGTDSSSPIKYIDTRIIKSTTLPRLDNWEIPESVDIDKFDLSWVPHPEDPPYIYVFGNQWFPAEKMPTVKYQVEGATEIKYVSTITATLKPDMTNWIVPKNIVIKDFDFSWVPDPYDPPYNYIFGNQWYGAQEMTTVTYASLGATEDKFVTDIVATLGKNLTNWEIPEEIDVRRFDFSWIPHPAAPPYIYQFGTLQDPTDGPKYITPTNTGQIVRVPRLELDIAEVEEEIVVAVEEPKDTEINRYYITTTLEALANQHVGELFWALNPDIDYSNFDFSWRPNIEQAHYVHAFGSTDNINTQTYFVNGPQWAKNNRDLNYVDDVKIDIKVNIDMFFVDRGNLESAARFEALKAKFGTRIQKTRYLNSWVDTINRCANRATSSLIWVLNSELDYNDFNFDYYPNPWQMKMVHVFGTQWSHWGTTFMVNRETFAEDTKYINIIEHLSNLNFVKDIRATATRCVHDIVIIDHGNKELADISSLLQSKASGKTVTTVSYQESYLKTFKDIIARQQAKKEHFIWVCSSVCDYSNFDFSYVCDPFSRDNLHVFPSGKQKFGDTFFIDVNNAREVIGELEQLENFTKVNYNAAVKAARLPEPIIVTNDDTHTNAASKITDFPYVTLITSDNDDIGKADIEPMNLWSPETKNIYVTSTGATRIVVPKEIKDHVTKELYEYPYIKRAPKLALSNPLDIVFLSNGETGAEENYEHLLNITKNLPNRVVRVDGVNGRAAAYHAAAEASNTPWMFTVFAKLKVSPKFDFNWQPDRMQVPKHYIFHAKNPVNGLTYGHQAMIAYNKKLTLANDGKGLDFTLDDEHEVVPLISGTAQYNTDEFSTWRTAFREVIKLRADDSEVSKERLDAWLNKASGDFAQYSIKGALDADEYYDEVDGDFDKLRLSYEWAWLREKFDQF